MTGERLLQPCRFRSKRVVHKRIALPSCKGDVSEESGLKAYAKDWGLPITHASKRDASGLAILRLDVLYPFPGDFFGSLEMLVLPRDKIEIRIVKRRRRMLSDTVLDAKVY